MIYLAVKGLKAVCKHNGLGFYGNLINAVGLSVGLQIPLMFFLWIYPILQQILTDQCLNRI